MVISRADTCDAPRAFNDVHGLRFHPERKRGIGARFTGHKIEEIPLRHERYEAALGRQVREIGDPHMLIADDPTEITRFLMGQREEPFEKAEFMHELERRGMNGIAAKITEEVFVFLENEDL